MCPKCNESPCQCGGTKSSTQSPQAYWLTAYCATDGCNTTIRWPYNKPMGLRMCKWCMEREDDSANG